MSACDIIRMSVGEADQFCSTWSRSTTSTFKVAGTWGNWLEIDYQGRQAGYARNWLAWEASFWVCISTTVGAVLYFLWLVDLVLVQFFLMQIKTTRGSLINPNSTPFVIQKHFFSKNLCSDSSSSFFVANRVPCPFNPLRK